MPPTSGPASSALRPTSSRRPRDARSIRGRRRRLAAGRGAARPAGRREAGCARPRPSRPRAGAGSRPRRSFRTATASACASSGARRCRSHRGGGRARACLKAEYDRLEAAHAEADELPDEVEQRLGAIETGSRARERPLLFDPAEIARAGAFVSIDSDGPCWSSAAMSGPRTNCRSSRARATEDEENRQNRRLPCRSAPVRTHRDDRRRRRIPPRSPRRTRASSRCRSG